MSTEARGGTKAGTATRRSATLRFALLVLAGLLFAGFFALGSWQIARLQWKLALIARVDQRVHAAPVDAPSAVQAAQVSAEADEYRHVRLIGRWLPELSTRVQASTSLGSGFWLLTPLCRADGGVVLVNRGFIGAGDGMRYAAGRRADPGACAQAAGASVVEVTGLLRISETGGGFLRKNDASSNHWYSRDVAAIAAARGLANAAPYFIDADAHAGAGTRARAAMAADTSGEAIVPGAVGGAGEEPVGGLTVISFHNNHLVYAVTWYGLALMVAGACLWVVRDERRRSRGTAGGATR